MALASIIRVPPRSDPAVRGVALSWRRLTGGTARRADRSRRTLIACSGGADSSGLALALAAAVSNPGSLFVLAHVIHDMRPAAEALADRDAARGLAAALGLPFAEAEVAVGAGPGNREDRARRLRYAALAALAVEHGCPFIATAHHADDQLETIVMGLIRGAGPRGLAGAASRRRLGADGVGGGPILIRPALGVEREELRRLCTKAGWEWREDATNADRTRLRSGLRHGVLPQLARLRRGAARRAAQSAELLGDLAGLLQDRARGFLKSAEPIPAEGGVGGFRWSRASLQRERPIVISETLRLASSALLGGQGRDRLKARMLMPAAEAIRARVGGPKRFRWSRLALIVRADTVEFRRITDA